jgi:two-component system, OmpR family, response regulator QseB
MAMSSRHPTQQPATAARAEAPTRALLIDADTTAAAAVQAALGCHGFAVDHAQTGQAGLGAIATGGYEVVMLDLALVDMPGLALIEQVRGQGCCAPLLVVSADAAVSRRIEALNAGADDFLTKPCDHRELAARLRAIARRPRELLGLNLDCGNLSLSIERREIMVGSQPLELGAREFTLLEQLMRYCGRAVPRDALLDSLYGFDQEIESNPIEVHVHRIRKRLTDAGATVRIENRRGIGYVLVPASH